MKQLFLRGFLFLISCGSFSQQASKTDFTHLKAEVAIFPAEEKVEGELVYFFDVLEETDSVFLDAREMEFSEVKLNGERVEVFNDEERLWVISAFKESTGNELAFSYRAYPKQTLYFIGWDSAEIDPSVAEIYPPQVWSQGQGKYTSHWLPSFDDTNEKVEFDLTIDFKQGYEVISNGELVETKKLNDSVTRWEFDMQAPMSSYLVALAAGKYENQEITTSGGTPVKLYYYPGDEDYVEPTYRYTQQLFEFYEKEIGVAYPWQDYKQIPVRDFLYSGMENTGATIFSDYFMTDSLGFKDRNYVMVNAHELAHQWFGNLVTAASGEHHWLQEGFSTFYALLAEREFLGDEHYYWKLYESAEQLKEMSDKGKGEALINPKAGSTTYYQKGAWALHVLREEVGGESFREGVKNYLNRYGYQNATTGDFLREIEETSGKDLSGFRSLWLEQTAFPGTVALNSLKKSDFITSYMEIAALKEFHLQEKKDMLKRALEIPVNDYIGQEVVYQLGHEKTSEAMELYLKAFETNNTMVRQAIAVSLNEIPQQLKPDFESLLNDESYLTREAAFYNLWMHFPQDRQRYLEKMKGVEGFKDKNIRILWLALNLATPEYENEHQEEVYNELFDYTSPYHPFYVRQKAFGLLFQLDSFSDENLHDLLEGSQHKVGSFKSFSRQLLGRLLQDENYQTRFKRLKENLTAEQQKYLESHLQ